MPDKTRFALALLAAWGFVVLSIAATALLVAADLTAQEQALLAPMLRDHAASAIVVAVALVFPLALVLRALFRRYVQAPAQLDEDARIMLAANPGAPRPAARRRRDQAARRERQRLRRRQRGAAARRRPARARGERAHRAGAQPPGGADVGARAERDHVQRRGAHPAVQRPRDAAAAQAARQRRRGREGAQPRRARALDLRDLRPQPDHPRAGEHPRPAAPGRPRPGRELRHDRARGPARARADGAGARRAVRCGRRRGAGRDLRVRADARQHHPPDRDRQSPRPPAADADAGHPRVARQHARRDRDDRVVSRTWTRRRATGSSASSARRRSA